MNTLVPGSLLAVSLGLGAVLAYQIAAPMHPIEVHQTAIVPHAETIASPPEIEPPAKETFSAINARSLFSPTRQAVEEPAEAGKADMPPPNVTLIGVIIGPHKSVAILKADGAAIAISASVGQMIDGWRVVSIDAGRVVFHANVTDYEVKLRSASGLAPEPAPGQSQVPQSNQAPAGGGDAQ